MEMMKIIAVKNQSFVITVISFTMVMMFISKQIEAVQVTDNTEDSGLEDEVEGLCTEQEGTSGWLCCPSKKNVKIVWAGLPNGVDTNQYCEAVGQDEGYTFLNYQTLKDIHYQHKQSMKPFDASVMKCEPGNYGQIIFVTKSNSPTCALVFEESNGEKLLMRKVCGLPSVEIQRPS